MSDRPVEITLSSSESDIESDYKSHGSPSPKKSNKAEKPSDDEKNNQKSKIDEDATIRKKIKLESPSTSGCSSIADGLREAKETVQLQEISCKAVAGSKLLPRVKSLTETEARDLNEFFDKARTIKQQLETTVTVINAVQGIIETNIRTNRILIDELRGLFNYIEETMALDVKLELKRENPEDDNLNGNKKEPEERNQD